MFSEALTNFLRRLDPQVAAGIQAMSTDRQEAAAANLAERMIAEGDIGPWQTPAELRGARNPVDQIDWNAPPATVSPKQATPPKSL